MLPSHSSARLLFGAAFCLACKRVFCAFSRASFRAEGASSGGAAAQLARMAAPTPVFFPAGPVTRNAHIELNSADSVVTSTAFLGWEPIAAAVGAAPRVRLRLALAIRAFLARCKTSPLPADVAAAQAASPYRWRFALPFWTRIFDELKASGVFDAPFAKSAGARRQDENLHSRQPRTA